MSSPYLIWPDKRLREIAAPVEHIGPEEIALWDRMLKLMYDMPGVGLAAPQIGVLRRIAVVDCGNDKSAAIRLANPEIIEASEELREHDEASPNLPRGFRQGASPRCCHRSLYGRGGRSARTAI